MVSHARYEDGAYLALNPDWHVGDSAWKASQVIKMLDRHRLQPRTVSEIGCGAGEILRVLHGRMAPTVHFKGYEISPQAYSLCVARSADRLEFQPGDLLELDTEQFDLLLAMDVVEHIEDCFGFLRKLRSKADYKVFHIPLDISAYSALGPTLMRGRAHMGHIHYFTRATALATLTETGYQVLDWFYTFGAIHSPGQRGGSLPRRGLRWARHALYLANKELSVRVLGGASVLVLAR
jgi:hypothetical protein